MVNCLNIFRGRVFLFGANNEKWYFFDFFGGFIRDLFCLL